MITPPSGDVLPIICTRWTYPDDTSIICMHMSTRMPGTWYIIPGMIYENMNQSSFYVSPSLSVLVNGGNEARPQYLQSATCDASWSTGARILSSVVGAPQQKRQQQQQQQQQHILESRRTCFFFSYSYSLLFWGFCTTTSTTMLIKEPSYTDIQCWGTGVAHSCRGRV